MCEYDVPCPGTSTPTVEKLQTSKPVRNETKNEEKKE